ncbi:endonuclease VII [Curvibacter phage P26059B]|uniref:DNA endonuclease VII n=1 Tax=Curvibacter phage P26059B TaxID=1983784 RepID=A0A384UH45_9CAUD|nr:endonuclease VII [Curvibacter phage P26059B]ASJ79299.1 DNA endonuclease VII [Curvibacter phage P26059B]
MSLTPYKLKVSEVSVIRERLAEEQGGRCAICQLPLSKPVLDHDHVTGAVRATLHNGCNALLGKVENNYKRYGVVNLAAFLAGTAAYLQKHQTNRTGYLHPTFKTEEQKRERRNTKARAARAARKSSE